MSWYVFSTVPEDAFESMTVHKFLADAVREAQGRHDTARRPKRCGRGQYRVEGENHSSHVMEAGAMRRAGFGDLLNQRCLTCGQPIAGRPIAGDHEPWDHDPSSIARAYENEAGAIREHERRRAAECRCGHPRSCHAPDQVTGNTDCLDYDCSCTEFEEPVALDALEANGNVSTSLLTTHRKRRRQNPNPADLKK